jgi:hypothetical protein
LDAYPVCKACQYKIPQDDPDDVEGVHTKKRVPAKVMWYFFCNTTFETSIHEQNQCKVDAMAQRNEEARQYVETPH